MSRPRGWPAAYAGVWLATADEPTTTTTHSTDKPHAARDRSSGVAAKTGTSASENGISTRILYWLRSKPSTSSSPSRNGSKKKAARTNPTSAVARSERGGRFRTKVSIHPAMATPNTGQRNGYDAPPTVSATPAAISASATQFTNSSARASTREPVIPATTSGTSIPDVASATRAGHGCG